MKRILNVLRLLIICLVLSVIFAQYSLADECDELQCSCSCHDADTAASEIDRILDDPTTESRGEFGVIREDGEYVPFDWRVRWLKRFPKVSAGYLVWFSEEWEPRYGPAIYITAYTRPDIRNEKYMFIEYITPKTFELGAGNQVAITKFGWLILPIIDLKIDIGVVIRFENNIMEDGISPMIGISLLRL